MSRAHLPIIEDDGLGYDVPHAHYYDEPGRPRTRGDCAAGPRPCPWISCRHHLALVEVGQTMTRVLGLPLLTRATRGGADEVAWVDDVAEMVASMPETCALDVAERDNRDDKTLQEVADALGLTRERIRQIESKGLGGMRALKHRAQLR